MKHAETLDDLIEKYPKIFENMKEFYFRISSELPKGWVKDVDILCAAIQDRIDSVTFYDKEGEHTVPQLICTQIKEKYGGLRFYYTGGDAVCEGMIDLTTFILWNKCERCGSDKNIGTTEGWISRICENCKGDNLSWKKDE
jgi:hypothetical protein